MLAVMSWRDSAACKGKPASLFFDHDGETYPEKMEREATAKALCAICPVTAECLEDGKHLDGIWGGLTAAERRGRRRTTVVLERPFVQPQDSDLTTQATSTVSGDAIMWTVIETNGTHCIWQRDSEHTWHGFEWGVVRSGILTSVHDDLSAAYAAYGILLEC